jgi:hypothetical protein
MELIKAILDIFGGASGLCCNMNKSEVTAIRCSEDSIGMVDNLLPNQLSHFPIRYLGIPLFITKLPKSTFQPLIDRMVDALPTWKGRLMNKFGQLTLVKMTLSVMPTHTAICLELPYWVQKTMIKIMKSFLWTGTDTVQGGKCLVAWSRVQRPRQLGGLGVLDPPLFGRALQMRWLWLQHTDADHCWSSFPIKVDNNTRAFFKASMRWQVVDDTSILFWSDNWMGGQCIHDITPHLVVVVSQWAMKNRQVASTLVNHAWIADIT